MTTLAAAQAAVMMSIFKPLLMAAVLVGWAWVAGRLDKDAAYFYLQRRQWNLIQMGAAIIAFGLWMLIPYFWLGLPLALLILGGAVGAYAYYHNTKVPVGDRWSFSLDFFRAKIGEFQHDRAQKSAEVRLLEADGAVRDVPTPDSPEGQAHAAMEQVFEFALPRRAQEVDLRVDAQKATLEVVIDGVRYPQPEIDPRLALSLVDYLKSNAGLDVADRRKKQAGKLSMDAGGLGRHALAIITQGSTRGLEVSIEIDPETRTQLTLDDLGLLGTQRQQLDPLLAVGGTGVILVAAPPRQGLSTTLYSLVQRHDPYTQSIVTLEDRVQFEIEGVAHHQIEADAAPEAVAGRVAAMLRQDPRVFLISRLTDASVAKAVTKGAAETRFYIGVRDGDSFAALRTWMRSVGDARAGAQALTAIVAVRLVRKLCPTCRIAYKPDPAMLKKLNLPPDRVGQLYKHSGQVMVKDKAEPCPECLGVGYRGRIGVFELAVFDDEARKLAAAGQVDQLRLHLRKNKMFQFQDAGLAKVMDGITSISEITRVFSGKEEPPAHKSNPPAPTTK